MLKFLCDMVNIKECIFLDDHVFKAVDKYMEFVHENFQIAFLRDTVFCLMGF